MQRQVLQHQRASHEIGTKPELERTMPAIGYQQAGAIDRSEALVDIELPIPETGLRDFFVEVRAVSINPVDLKIRSSAALEAGQWKVLEWVAAGTVRAAGSGATLFHAGSAVFYAGTIGRAGTPKRLRIVCQMQSTARLFPAIRLLVAMLLTSVGASAQQPAPPGMSLATAAAKRFPQPVRVADLIGRTVLQPLESQPVLGRVRQVVRTTDGVVEIVIDYGARLGVGGRLIAVPVDAMTLLGAEMEVVDFTPKQLSDFPPFDGAQSTSITPDNSIRVGLARPSH